MLPRPPVVRTGTTPANVTGEFVTANPTSTSSSTHHTSPKNDDEDREELTTKGRKRKRLAKACSACHKNKRRCDGFAPCSNCEFSARLCLYINAAGERMPPPRTHDPAASVPTPGPLTALPMGYNPDSPTYAKRSPSEGQIAKPARSIAAGSEASDSPKHTLGSDFLDAFDKDYTLGMELVDLFFTRIVPFGAMFHHPTFMHRLYLDKVSPCLLDVMYANSCRMTSNSKLLGALPPGTPTWARGDIFADRARHGLDQRLEERKGWMAEQRRLDRGSWDETELIQSLSLLAWYFTCAKRPESFRYLDAAIDILRPGSITTPPPSSHANLTCLEHATLLEARHRTFWSLVFQDLSAAAFGRNRRMTDVEIARIPLPGDETLWEKIGGGKHVFHKHKTSEAEDGWCRDGLIPGTGTWPGEEGKIGEFGYSMRLMSILSEIIIIAHHSAARVDYRTTATQLESALKNWALSLPRHLQFDKYALTAAIERFQSPLTPISRTGWVYAYMHCIAECSMFYLQSAFASAGGAYIAQRQSQAVDNICIIMDAMGPRGREPPMMIFPLAVITDWHDHLRSSSAPPRQALMLDERLAVWWSEVAQNYGWDRRTVLDYGFYPGNIGARADRHHPSALQLYPLQPVHPGHPGTSPTAFSSGSLELYATSPPRGPDSSTSSVTLPTPQLSAYRYPLAGSLPPLSSISNYRPRAYTTAEPQLPLSPACRGLPTPLSYSDSRLPQLPPLPSLDTSGYALRGRDEGRAACSPRDDLRDKMERGLSVSPRYDPYAHARRAQSTSPMKSDRSEGKAGRGGQNTRGVGLVGIAALVSAAEEKSREEGV